MDQFKGVTVQKKANVYFEGKVTSRTILFEDGTKKTLGIMLPGEYVFGTDLKEHMEIVSGDLRVKLPDQPEWLEIRGSGEFTAPGKGQFSLEVLSVTDYCCSYIEE